MHGNATLRSLPVAQDDLGSILEFIATDSPRRALSLISRLDERIAQREHYCASAVEQRWEYTV